MSLDPGPDQRERTRLVAITLDQGSLGGGSANVEREREVAIFDILEDNRFELVGHDGGPYRLHLAAQDDRLAFEVTADDLDGVISHVLSLSPLRRIMKDYFTVCDSYYNAIRTAPPSRIQAIDMGRRSLHDEGSRVLVERLEGKVVVDFDTARRLFTLVCALRWRG